MSDEPYLVIIALLENKPSALLCWLKLVKVMQALASPGLDGAFRFWLGEWI